LSVNADPTTDPTADPTATTAVDRLSNHFNDGGSATTDVASARSVGERSLFAVRASLSHVRSLWGRVSGTRERDSEEHGRSFRKSASVGGDRAEHGQESISEV